MKKIYSVAIGLVAICCTLISVAATHGLDEKAIKIGKTFSTTSIGRKTIGTPDILPATPTRKKVSSQGFPSRDELCRGYLWTAYEYNYNDWITREFWINQGASDNGLSIYLDSWTIEATYNSSDGKISIPSRQFIRHDDYNDLDVYFYHCRWNEEGDTIVFLDTPMILKADGIDLSADPDDLIYIGAEGVGFFICAQANSFADGNRPSGYYRVGNTKLFSRINGNIDIYGLYNGNYYRSTYADGGYKVSMQVNGGSARQMDCANIQSMDGMDFVAGVEQQGEFARIFYVVTNKTEEDAVVSLGTHADVMIGGNDGAPISRRIDTLGQTYGLTMSDGNGAQLCVLFGDGLTGVSAVDDFWFGYYGQNSGAYEMVGNYQHGGNFMEENGGYDSGMGWCWKNRTIPAGETVEFAYLIGVGDVNLEPNFSFAVTPEDVAGWNNLALPHQLTINGEYNSPAAVDGRLEYAVEDSQEWVPLTEMLPSGSEFEGTMTVMFDESRPKHVIRFRTVDNVGNTTMLQPIEYVDVKYIDVTGVEERTYNGQPQTLDLTSEQLTQEEFTASYINNVNAGTASFRVEGVFPYSIGRSAYRNFTINPRELEGDIALTNDAFIFNGNSFQPEWSFTNESYSGLIADQDYTAIYSNNCYPGTGTVEIKGIHNYTGTFKKNFTIDKAPLAENLYTIGMPDSDIVYDGKAHTATFFGKEGVGVPTIIYRNENGEEFEQVSAAGHYGVFLSVAEGDWYYGIANRHIGSFSIYNFDDTEWLALNAINTQLQAAGISEPWNVDAGITSVGTFDGLEIKEGHVVGIDLSSKGLTGEFPVSVLALPQLKKIDVSDNDLSGDLPTTLMAIAAQNPAALASVDTLKLGGNGFSGNLGLIGQGMPSLEYLDASYNKFEDLYPALPETVKYLDIRGQEIERTVDLNLSHVEWEELKTQIPSIILYDPKAYGFTNQVGLIMSTAAMTDGGIPSGDVWALQLYINGGDITPAVMGGNTYRGQSGDTLYVYCIQDGQLNGTRFNVNLSFEQGDANFFNGIDASDLQATVLYAFGEYNSLPFNFTAANTYADDVINVQDVTCTVNILLSQLAQTPEALPAFRKVKGTEEEETEASIILSGGKVILHSEKAVAAMTLKASGDVEWIADRYGMTQSVSGSNLVVYSLSGATIPSGYTIIGEYSGDAEVVAASLADEQAVPVSVSVNVDSLTGVSTLPFDLDDDCYIYDAAGIRHPRPVRGLNIIVRDGKTVRYYNTK